eukprot:590122_1
MVVRMTITHMIGIVTHFSGILLLTNTVCRIYVNEILYQSGIITQGRIICKTRQRNMLKRHQIYVEFAIHSAQSIICGVTFEITQQMYDLYSENDNLDIIYARQLRDDKFYHNIKERMDDESKPVTLYSNIALSMMLISFYPFIYLCPSRDVFFLMCSVIISCVITMPHHYRWDFQSNGLKRMATHQIIDKPQETIAVLYDSYIERPVTPPPQDDYVMIFN